MIQPQPDPRPAPAGLALPTMAVFAGLVVLTRLPRLLDPVLIPDLDESVLGIMAMHLLSGEGVPVFFYGQHYGFSLLEAGAVAAIFAVAGPSVVALKAAVLAVWILGGMLLILACRRFAGARAGWVAAALLAACPAWATWCMKARGGYQTAFLLTMLILWLLARRHATRGNSVSAAAATGGAAALVVFAQAIWLPIVAAFLGLAAFGRRPGRTEAVGFLAGAAALTGFLLAVTAWLPPPVWTTPRLAIENLGASAAAFPEAVFTVFTGRFLLDIRLGAGPLATVAAASWCAALGFAVVRCTLGVRDTARGRPAVLAAFLGASAGYLVVRGAIPAFRYLLPLADTLVIFLALELARPGRLRAVAVGVLVIAGAISVATSPLETRAVRHAAGSALDGAIALFRAHGIRHVYCADKWSDYALQFRTREAILARRTDLRSRIPGRAEAVDRARAAGEPTALLGPLGALPTIAPLVDRCDRSVVDRLEAVGGLFFVLRDPPRELLEDLEFRLHAP